MIENNAVRSGRGNPFADLGFENPQEETFVSELGGAANHRKLTQARAADPSDVSPKLPAIVAGRPVSADLTAKRTRWWRAANPLRRDRQKPLHS